MKAFKEKFEAFDKRFQALTDADIMAGKARSPVFFFLPILLHTLPLLLIRDQGGKKT